MTVDYYASLPILSLTAILSAEDGPAVSGDFSVVPVGGYGSYNGLNQ